MNGSNKNIYRLYLGILLISLVLLSVSVGVSRLGAGILGIGINLLIAILIAGLIAIYYMGLRWSTALVRLFAGATVVWLIFMFVLTLADYLTR